MSQDGVRLTGEGGRPPIVRTTAMASRITTLARPIFVTSIVVIDLRSVEGLSVTQVADYAAMRAYSDADPARAKSPGPPTILTVLEAPMGSEIPRSMTEWDFSFLRGLYQAPANQHAGAQRGAISRYMKTELSRANDNPRQANADGGGTNSEKN